MAAAAAVGKTPVSVLQELLSRRGTTPKYELVQIEGAIHEPTFRYRVTVGDVVAMGTGRSKKEAKHSAAKALLDKMVVAANSGDDSIVVNSENISEVKTEILSPYDNKIPGNPIGSLQEMCMSRRWPPPNYEMVHEEGLPHERLFTIACYVFKYKETGTGKSKKLAKRQAAHKMWQRLQDLPVTAAVAPVPDDDDEISQQIGNVAAHFSDLKDCKLNTTHSAHHNQKVSQFHKQMKLLEGQKLNDLQNTPLNTQHFNFGQFLQEIAAEQNFEVTYVDIEEKSVTANKCKEKGRNLRSVFVCHLKPLPSGSRAKKPYYLSEAMKFTLQFIKTTSTPYGNLSWEAETTCTESQQMSEFSQNENLTEEEQNIYMPLSPATPPPPQAASSATSLPQQDMLQTCQSHSPRLLKHKQSQADVDKSFKEYLDAKKRKLETTASDPQGKRTFLLSLLPKIEPMTDAQMRLFRRRVLQVIDEIMNCEPPQAHSRQVPAEAPTYSDSSQSESYASHLSLEEE